MNNPSESQITEHLRCDECDTELTFIQTLEVNKSNWDVHDGDIVSEYKCETCEDYLLLDSEGNSVLPRSC